MKQDFVTMRGHVVMGDRTRTWPLEGSGRPERIYGYDITDSRATQHCSTSKVATRVASTEGRGGTDDASDSPATVYFGSTSPNHCLESTGSSYTR